MMRKWLFATAMLLPGVAAALGLGKLELNSALNEPFDARIRLLSVSVEELDSLKAGLASNEAFERAGILYGYDLSKLRFEVRETEDGPDYIRVYSTEPIREPFLNFLLEVNWNQGRLYREYTVLLDPPTYDPNRRLSTAPVAPASTTAPGSYGPVQPIADNQVTYDLDYRAPAPARTTPMVSYSGGDYGPTQAGDTLWSIASSMRPDNSVSVQQMMIALLRANPEAFIGNNINGLKRGQILAMPDADAVSGIGKSEAVELAKSQNELWNDIRSGMAEAVTERPESAGISGTAEEAPTMTGEPMVEGEAELRLVAPDTSGEGIDEGVTETAMDAETEQLLALANETIAALEMENTELKDKLAESESIIEDLKRLIQLKEDELAVLQEQIASAAAMEEAAAEAEEIVEEAVMEDEVAAEEEMEEAEAMDEEAEAEMAEEVPADAGIMGMVNQYLGPVIGFVKSNLIMVGGIVGGILVLLIGFVAYQKRQSGQAETVDIPEADFPDFEDVTEAAEGSAGEMMDVVDSEASTVVPEAETEEPAEEDKTPTPVADEETPADAAEVVTPEAEPEEAPAEAAAEEEDPLAEVNVFLAFDQFDQAIDFVKSAIEREPDNLDFHSRLLEVYYSASDKKGYEEEARVLHDKVNGEGPYWDSTVAMWSEMSPNRALFEEGAEEEEEAPAEAGAGGIMDLTAGEEEAAEAEDAGGLDFDIGGDDEGVLDVTSGADTDAGEAEADEEILDVTAAINSEESEDLLDVTAAVGLDDTASESTAAAASTTADEEDENMLDITGGGEDDEVLDLTTGTDSGADEDMLDISAGAEPEPQEDVLDISQASGEDLLDVTKSTNLTPDSDEDLLDVTSASTASADSDSLLDIDAGAEDEAGESADEGGLDFDMEGLDLDISDEAPEDEADSASMIEQVMDSEDDNVIDFDTARADADDDVEGTVEVDAAKLGIETTDETEGAEAEASADVDLDLTLEMDSDTAEDQAADDDLSLDMEIPASGSDEAGDMTLELDTGDDADSTGLSLDTDDDTEATSDLDLDLDLDIGEDSTPTPAATDEDVPEIDMESTVELPKSKLDMATGAAADDDDDKTVFVPKSGSPQQSQEDEVSTKLDLAKAYVELGDSESAKNILQEIMDEGTEEQKQQAQDLLNEV